MFPDWFTKLVEEIVAEKESGLTTAELLLRIAERLGKAMTDMASSFTAEKLAAASQALGSKVNYKKGKWYINPTPGGVPASVDVTLPDVAQQVAGIYAAQFPGQLLTILAQLPDNYKPGTRLVLTVLGVHPPTTTSQTPPADSAK